MWPFNNAKRENELMNALERKDWLIDYYAQEICDLYKAIQELKNTINRQAKIIGRYQAAKPLRDADGKFTKSHKVRETTQALAASMGLPDPFIKVT
jgi:hypothetical protein